jgi:galactofuranosylgalactofuranosylrhamnosyl-N-acetylglucosaminyl-diphospho-decaprenol beta-1,5/1,6-galactofuranosyltransferase
MAKVMAGTLHQFRKPRDFQRPQLTLPYQDAGWWVLARLDSAVVSTPDGTTAAWYKRDRKQFRELAWRRAASAEFTSPAKWRETFEASLRDRPGGP